MYCVKCGNKLPENSRFCPNCGIEIGSMPDDNKWDVKKASTLHSTRTTEKLRTNELWLSLLLGASVSGGFYIIYYIYLKLQSPQTTAISFYLKFVLILSLVLVLSAKQAKVYIKDGIKKMYQPFQLRGIVGTSLGAMLMDWGILGSIGMSSDMTVTTTKLFGASIAIIAFAIIEFKSAKKKKAIKANMVSLSYLAGVFNWLFWFMSLIAHGLDGKVPDDLIGAVALIILLLPVIISIIAGICFYRCRRG